MPEPSANQPDEILAQDARNGALEAFDELVRRYQHRIYGFVLQSVSNPADAREVTQDVFLRAFTALHQFHSRKVFSAWLFAIARNRAIDHLRARASMPDDPEPTSADHDDPSELLARQEDQSQIWARARQLLPELHFQCLWLRYVEDLDVAQIAAVLGRTKTHVKVLLFRARRLLAAGIRSPAGSAAFHLDRRKLSPSAATPAPNFCTRRRESAPTL